MHISRFVVGVCSGAVLSFNASTTSAQTYPDKPLRIITSSIGGGNDAQTRIIAPRLTDVLNEAVVIDNRVSNLRSELGARAAPDGYTMLIEGNTLWTLPLLQKVSFDPFRDFSPVTTISREVTILVVNPQVPIKSAKDLIALAKAKPGTLNWGSGSNGSGSHLAGELFKSMAGIDIVRISYKGSGPALNDVAAGHTQVMFASSGSALSQIKAGRVTALAVGSDKPSALVPHLPTISASGLPGYESSSASAAFFPAKTPAPIVKRLNAELGRILTNAEVKEKLMGFGLEPVGGPPEQLVTLMKAEIARMNRLIKETGFKIDSQ